MEEEKEMHQQDWYAILNCSHSAGKEEIEKSARKLFLKYHPDKTSDPRAPEQFSLVQRQRKYCSTNLREK
jgi:DnaJ-class molecular chaperone